jgi:hypothetical protein
MRRTRERRTQGLPTHEPSVAKPTPDPSQEGKGSRAVAKPIEWPSATPLLGGVRGGFRGTDREPWRVMESLTAGEGRGEGESSIRSRRLSPASDKQLPSPLTLILSPKGERKSAAAAASRMMAWGEDAPAARRGRRAQTDSTGRVGRQGMERGRAGAHGLAGAGGAGITSFWPTLIASVLRLFAARSALTVVLCMVATFVSVSPDLTV